MENETVKIIELKREIRKFAGIEYALVLKGFEGQEIDGLDNINDKQWWDLEYTEKSATLGKKMGNGFLWKGTGESMKGKRMQDKYHEMELCALRDITSALDTFIENQGRYVAIQFYIWVYLSVLLFPKSVIFKIKKLFKSNGTY